jgi:hypothetical protein
MNVAGTIEPPRCELLELGIVTAQVLGELRERSHSRAPIAISRLLERQDVLDAQPAMFARPRERDPLLLEQTNEVLPRHLKQVGRLLGRELLADGTTVTESPRAMTSATRSST